MKRIIIAGMGLWLLMEWGVTQAFGMLVYDPINHIETAVTAANAVRQTAQQLMAYLLQLQQLALQIQNLRSLPQNVMAQVLTPYSQQMVVAQTLYATLSQTAQQLQVLKAGLVGQAQQMVLLQQTPQNFLQNEIQFNQTQGYGLGAALQQELGTLQGLGSSYGQIQSLQTQIPAAAGMQQSLQTVNQHLNLLAGQNNQLMGLIATAQANVAARQQYEAQNNGAAAQVVQQRLQTDAQKIQQWQGRLTQNELSSGWGVMSAAGSMGGGQP
ncbi:MAG: hypothetical protein M0Z78_09200 [Betaproteobacteria bacterium]|nr:hypothetical protein [Betaproteobacteria bacterium]